jgi:2-polyprenyl-3-methyl-5-hydroxy-6-metoxy-1,4-benzoquinol methylase
VSGPNPTLRCPCEGRHLARFFGYTDPPKGETHFDLKGQVYARSYSRCSLCGHFFSSHEMDIKALYRQDYVDSTYGGPEGMWRAFERITALPPDQSDNTGRVARIVEFAEGYWGKTERARTLLDVGSGLGVFPYVMKQSGWDCTALDPDSRATAFAHEIVGIKSVNGNFFVIPNKRLGHFDVITYNKVLEHVEDPVAMLARSADYLEAGGFVYVEVPDGEAAMIEGPGREEFFVEHHHVFSMASAVMLAERAGLTPVMVERLREPSSKLTICLFLIFSSAKETLK